MKLSKSALLVFTLGLSVLFSSQNSFATGDAGCGLGSMIISKNSKLLQLFALTTNSSFLTQPLGITSGTSNCSASGIVQNDKEKEYFVELNQDDLIREMAQGRGEKLATLGRLYGCRSEGANSEFAAVTQKHYGEIFTSAAITAPEVIAHVNTQVSANSELTKSCLN